MALLVLAFAVTLRDLAFLNRNPDYGGGAHPRRALIVVLILLTVASVFVYSIPGLVWFALALPIWLLLELVHGRPADRPRGRAERHEAPPPGADRRRSAGARRRRLLGVAALRLRQQGRHGAGVRGQAQLARLPRRGARDLARGRLPDRARRRRRRLPGRGARPAGRRDRGVRRLPSPRLGARRDGRQHGDRLHRRPPLRVDLRGGEGAGGDVPPCGDGDPRRPLLAELGPRRRPRAGGRRDARRPAEEGTAARRPDDRRPLRARRHRRRRARGLDAPGAARDPRRVRPARRPSSSTCRASSRTSPSSTSGSIASPATGCAAP